MNAAISDRRAQLAFLLLIALALTIPANAATAHWPPSAGRAVLIVAEVLAGVALGRAAIAAFRRGGDPSMRDMAIVICGGFGIIFGLLVPAPWLVRMANGIHGALIGGLIVVAVSFAVAYYRWYQRMEDEAGKERDRALAAHEALATPVTLPTWNRRFAARVLDTLLLIGASLLLAIATGANWLVLAVPLWALYDIALHAALGATAGKALCRIRVVHSDGAARVGMLRAAGRWALLVVNVPFIWMQTSVTGDLVWSIDPRLSAMKPVYCGTILTTAAEHRRLAGLAPGVRAKQLADTFRAVRAIPGPLTRRTALVVLVVILVIAILVTRLPPPPD